MSDLIDRGQAIKEIYRKVSEQESNAIPGEDLDVGVIVGLKMAVRIIKDQLSAEKTGEWVLVDEAEPRRYGCSCCKRLSYTMDNYCSYCGARMEE